MSSRRQFFSNEQIEQIRRGYYSAIYFNKAKRLSKSLEAKVTMQIFARQECHVYGIEEVLEILRECVGEFDAIGRFVNKADEIKVNHVNDGEFVGKDCVIMKIKGDYSYFAHLESVYLGILARSSKVYTNVKSLRYETDLPLYFFADRFDRFENQNADGRVALAAGCNFVTTPAMANGTNIPVGSMPHALIAVNNGNVVDAVLSHMEVYDEPVVALIDYNNDCIGDAKVLIESLNAKGKLRNLWGFRLDTSANLIDEAVAQDLFNKMRVEGGLFIEDWEFFKGVSPALVRKFKSMLQERPYTQRLKIMVSGGITPQKIENLKNYVDAFGVGSYILNKGSYQFTADIVTVNDKEQHKHGRKERRIYTGQS